jgi:energy-coupling factor transporter transmembrane protein EcfT
MRKLFLVLFSLLKFLTFSLAGAVLITGGTYTTWSYYASDLPTHWVFSFCGPLMVVAGIGMITAMTVILNEDIRNA